MNEGRKDGRTEGPGTVAMRAALVTGVLLFVIRPGFSTAHAQSDPRVVAAVRQAQEGSGDSARAALSRVLQSIPASDPVYPEALYATALISPTAQEMQRFLQRVVVEHALSPWADDAILKLAQLEYASGNLPGTVRHLDRIRADFPRSDVLGLAAFWAARAHFDLRDERSACRWIGTGLAATPAEATDVRAQLDAFARRCPGELLAAGAMAAPPRESAPQAAPTPATPTPATLTPPPADTLRSAPSDPAPPPPSDTIRLAPTEAAAAAATERAAPQVADAAPVSPPIAAPAGPAFRIQVVAAGTQQAADAAIARLERLGFSTRIAREGGFLKVRAGSYATRAEANAARQRLTADFPGAFVVPD
jgi:cell division septation protein DedD